MAFIHSLFTMNMSHLGINNFSNFRYQLQISLNVYFNIPSPMHQWNVTYQYTFVNLHDISHTINFGIKVTETIIYNCKRQVFWWYIRTYRSVICVNVFDNYLTIRSFFYTKPLDLVDAYIIVLWWACAWKNQIQNRTV